VTEVAEPRGERHQAIEARAPGAQERRGLIEREDLAALGAREGASEQVRRRVRHERRAYYAIAVRVAALAGGVGAGKFLRGLVRAVPPADVTAIVNTGDDIALHGLHVSPDLDSVTYWLGGAFDRERGWGRRDESFRAIEELGAFDADAAWFRLGDLDLATHLFRTGLLARGVPLSEVARRVAARFGIAARILPMTDDPVATRVDVVDAEGRLVDLHFQEYWVLRGARDEVKAVRFDGIGRARPASGVLEAIAGADAVVICPSNPVVSISPILSVGGVRDAVAARRPAVVGISPIVGGAPLAGMADRLMPALGYEVSAAGAARAYDGLLGAWLIDERDRDLAPRVEELGVRAGVADTVMGDDDDAERIARAALELVGA
jgi:LPPG:FO 2-phospho-L-lactate transferase